MNSIHAEAGSSATNSFGNNSPVTFIKNQGQWIPEIIYKGTSTATSVSLLNDGISFCNAGEEIENPDGSEVHTYYVWNLRFLSTTGSIITEGENLQESKLSYLFGNDPSEWVIHPEEYASINYKNIYHQVDLKFYGQMYDLKYDYIVKPGGSIASIQSAYEGIEELTINSVGELEVRTQWHTQVQRTPVAWQIKNGVQQFVNVQYVLLNDSTFGFTATNGYDQHYDLIIDPLFQMAWASYTNIPGGGNNINYCFANEMDNAGNVYLTGIVDGTFPITPGAYSGPGNVYPEIFVAKFSSDGTTMIYGTYLPGSSSEFGADIAVDALGRAYVTGVVDLNITGITNFPSTPNAYQPVHNSGSDAFLTVLNPTGTGLIYSTFLGGSNSESGYGIALGGNGTAYITGYTSIGNFPVVASQSLPSGDNDVFVAKFDINQSGSSSLIYSARIGGGPFTYCKGRSIAVNSQGNAFITGTVYTSSSTLLYPTSPGAYNNVFNGGMDGTMVFVTKLSSTTPVYIEYSTFIGPGTGNAIAVDPATNEAYVAGTTNTTSFPVTPGALQTVHDLQADAFALKLNANGSALQYSTFLGGPMSDIGTGLALNSAGEAYISGIAQDQFPTSPGSFQPNNAGTYDFFVVNLNSNGNGYGCGGSTYVGGSDADYSGSFYDYPSPKVSIMDNGGVNDTILVSSTTHSQDFPTTPGSYGPVKINGIADQPVFFKLTCFSPGALPDGDITSTDVSLCDNGTIDFSDQSLNNPTAWTWYFPGAVPSTSTLQNPMGVTYSNQGSFDVILVACNSFGCDSTVFPDYISVYPGPGIPFLITSGDTIISTPAYSYQWYNNGIPIPGDTNQYFVPTQDGVYYVEVTDSLGCSAISKSATITAVEEFSETDPSVTIYPNPVSDHSVILVRSNGAGFIKLHLFDVAGKFVRKIYEGELKSNVSEIEFDEVGLGKGIYFLEIVSGKNTGRIKVLID